MCVCAEMFWGKKIDNKIYTLANQHRNKLYMGGVCAHENHICIYKTNVFGIFLFRVDSISKIIFTIILRTSLLITV